MTTLLQLDLFLRKDNNQSKFTPYQVLALYAIVGINGVDPSWKVNQSMLVKRLSISERHLRDTLKPLIKCGIIALEKSHKYNNYTVNIVQGTYTFPDNDLLTGTGAPISRTKYKILTGTPVPVFTGTPVPVTEDHTLYINKENNEKKKEEEKEKEKEEENIAAIAAHPDKSGFTFLSDDFLINLSEGENMKAEVKEIFSYWKERMNHPNAKCDPKRERLINAMLKIGYTVRDLKDAIDGCAKSSFHMGDNENGKIYDDISLIVRDASHVDSFMKSNSTEEIRHVPKQKLTRAQQSVEDGLEFLRTLNFVN